MKNLKNKKPVSAKTRVWVSYFLKYQLVVSYKGVSYKAILRVFHSVAKPKQFVEAKTNEELLNFLLNKKF